MKDIYICMLLPMQQAKLRATFCSLEKRLAYLVSLSFSMNFTPHLLISIKSFHNLFNNFTVPSNAKHFFSYDILVNRIFYPVYLTKLVFSNDNTNCLFSQFIFIIFSASIFNILAVGE